MNERKHLSLVDSEGKTLRVYAGIPTILPSGSYTFNESITDDFMIFGETGEDVTWSFKEHRWITSKPS